MSMGEGIARRKGAASGDKTLNKEPGPLQYSTGVKIMQIVLELFSHTLRELE